MDTKKLRQKILDLAIRGKLVPQDPNDEPASVLLERIRAEKERLIKEGKIKRSKKSASDTPHYENEVPFEVPEGWVCCQVSDIFELNPKNDIPDDTQSGFIPMACVDDGFGYSHTFETRVWKEIRKGYSHFQNGDIGIAKISPCFENRKSTIFYDLPNGIGAGTTELTVLRGHCVNTEFYLYLFQSEWYIFEGTKEFKGVVGQQRVNKEIFTTLLIPLPPIEEQNRIVTEIKKWFTLIDTLESAKEDLQASITQAKSIILDLAIHGKLVLQDPNDEPAIELLRRINPKFTPCDNAHYENVPSNWTTILLGDLCFTINGLWKGKKPPFVNVGVIRNANFTKDCKLDYTNIAYLDVEVKQYEKRKLQCGDIIVEKSGGSDNQPVGRTILFERKDGDYSFSNFTSVLRIYDGYPAIPEFLNMFLQSIYQTGVTKRMQTQTTGIHNLIFDQFLDIPVLLPPIAEQSRIINKVNELFQLLDNMSADL